MIPIYRAKRIDSDEYVEGYYYFDKEHYIHGIDTMWVEQEIDPSTIAIHFPDMIDSEGNKIFASLSEDGKGGDKYFNDNNNEEGTFIFDSYCTIPYFEQWEYYKITGIQQ